MAVRLAVRASAAGVRVDAENPQLHPALRLATRALLVGLACFLATETVAWNLPPLFVSPVWPTNSILLCALLATPVRHWWAYALAGFASSVNHNAHTGAPFLTVPMFLVADVIEVVGAALAVRFVAGGLRALDSPRALVAYLAIVVVGPLVAGFAAAIAAPVGEHWRLARSWFLTDTSGYLTLAPAILTWIGFSRPVIRSRPRVRNVEAGLLGTGLLLTTARVFMWPTGIETNVPALMYLPLPFLLWAGVRFGPRGGTASIAMLALLAMSGALRGYGPFHSSNPAANTLSLQLFLMTVSPPLMFVAVLAREQERSRMALKRGEARYRAVVEDQTELICRFLPDGTYTFVNGAFCRDLHRSAEHLVGRSFWDILPAEDHAVVRKYLDSITPNRPVASREYEVVVRGRDVRWHQWTTRGFFDEHGAVTEYQAVGRDITERKRAEMTAKENEAQLRLFVEHSPAAVAMFDRDMKYIIYSRRWLKDLKLGAQSLVGRSHYDVFPELPDRWKEVHRRCLAGAVETCDEDPFLQLDGSVDWIRWEVRPWHEANGEAGGLIFFSELITERKRAEKEHRELEAQRQIESVLRASEERFRSLADNAPVLIWMSGPRNEGVYFNKPWLDFTGRSLEDEIGSGWTASIHPEDRQRCIDTCDGAFGRREPVTLQFRLRRHDGEYRWVLDNGVPYFRADGAFSGYVGSCLDITSRKLAEEELEQAARRKDEFLAMLGHELRNPLAPIGVAVEIMRDVAPIDESIAWARDVIARQLGLLTRLVDDLLDVARISRGEITLVLTPLEVRSVVAQAVETSRPLIDSRDHQLTVNVPSHPVWVRGDAVRLGQVLANLLNNAAKYTPNGGRIELTVERRDSQVTMSVADNGVGLTAEALERVFDLFWQSQSRADAQGGLGIGLTLVKRLLELHGGDIEARSAGRRRGSQFIVRLPAWEVHTEPPTGGTPAEPRQSLIRRRILVVDDNVDAAESFSRILRLQGQDVSVAHDGHAALQIADAIQPEVVFLDLELPGVNGFEVAQRLGADGRSRPSLLVAITGFGQEEDRRRTQAAGFDHHLVKPVDPRVLRSLLANKG